MKRKVQLEIEEYIYQFYQKGAEVLRKTPEVMMEQALRMYAGMIAEELLRNDEEILMS